MLRDGKAAAGEGRDEAGEQAEKWDFVGEIAVISGGWFLACTFLILATQGGVSCENAAFNWVIKMD